MKQRFIGSMVLACALSTLPGLSSAGVTLESTRVVFPPGGKEASILVKNRASEDVMIQSWVESGSDPKAAVPFAITPSLSRLGPAKQQVLRIFYQGRGLPSDKESVFWLNVQEIPQKARSDNTLQIAVRQRVKVFYRPAGLPGNADEAASNLVWRVVEADGKPFLEVRNDARFNVSFGAVKLLSGRSEQRVPVEMAAPGGTQRVELAGKGATPTRVEYETVNDYGAIVAHASDVSPS
ncbi:molecular chaperone [Burkholderia pseudomultivorans]|uniref:Molecular chaperone n=1 Tax=Burkholderia pseudomultivorans TaxID=1207504 RepID=A0A132F3B6_9BURK|nr:molecular chaperone [Burkholderia pseudomultivorans]KWF67539.1 molecular chaperone [Burkholderia pseudomultivorans]